jgi:hypothetical protein
MEGITNENNNSRLTLDIIRRPAVGHSVIGMECLDALAPK